MSSGTQVAIGPSFIGREVLLYFKWRGYGDIRTCKSDFGQACSRRTSETCFSDVSPANTGRPPKTAATMYEQRVSTYKRAHVLQLARGPDVSIIINIQACPRSPTSPRPRCIHGHVDTCWHIPWLIIVDSTTRPLVQPRSQQRPSPVSP